MKKLVVAAVCVLAAASASAADVGVSITVGDPGFYGRLDLGNTYRPQLIYNEPIIIERPVVGYVQQPLYLRVPPGHAKHWEKHCYQYNACGRRVLFVQDNWYNQVYAPQFRERSRGGNVYVQPQRNVYVERVIERDDDHDEGRGHGKDKGEHGNGKGKGKGHGKHDRDD